MRMYALVTALALAIALGAAPVAAAPKVTVSISGSIDEMLPILQHLQAMGFGFGASEPEESGIKVDMHSFSSEGGAAEAVRTTPNKVAAGLTNTTISPAKARPGDLVKVTVQANDPEHHVDTIGATVKDMEGGSFDLYDNGRYGDKEARDGVWSYVLTLPANAKPGTYSVTVVAFDENGEMVKAGADRETERWTTSVSLTVSP